MLTYIDTNIDDADKLCCRKKDTLNILTLMCNSNPYIHVFGRTFIQCFSRCRYIDAATDLPTKYCSTECLKDVISKAANYNRECSITLYEGLTGRLGR